MGDRAVRRERFLPYAYERSGLDLRVTAASLGPASANAVIDADRRTVELDGSWDRAEVVVQVELSPGVLQKVLPEVERAAPPVGILAAVRCSESRLRVGTWIARGPISFGTHEGRLSLRKSDLAGTAELAAFLVRETARAERSADYASHRGARVAGSGVWELRIDRNRSAGGNRLEVRFRRFSEDETLAPFERDSLYRLDADLADPVLWINADHERVAAAMSTDAASGPGARFREVAFDLVAGAVWQQLFLRATLDVVERGETVYPWQQSVLDELLPALYPDLADRVAREDRLRYEADDLPALLGRIDSLIQRRSAVVRHLEALLGEQG